MGDRAGGGGRALILPASFSPRRRRGRGQYGHDGRHGQAVSVYGDGMQLSGCGGIKQIFYNKEGGRSIEWLVVAGCRLQVADCRLNYRDRTTGTGYVFLLGQNYRDRLCISPRICYTPLNERSGNRGIHNLSL
jgi:hypothetical protein